MDNETFIMLDENGNEKNAKIITVIEVNNQEYVVYAIEKDNENDNIYTSRLITDEQGNQKIEEIKNEKEKEEVFKIVKDIINNIDSE